MVTTIFNDAGKALEEAYDKDTEKFDGDAVDRLTNTYEDVGEALDQFQAKYDKVEETVVEEFRDLFIEKSPKENLLTGGNYRNRIE